MIICLVESNSPDFVSLKVGIPQIKKKPVNINQVTETSKNPIANIPPIICKNPFNRKRYSAIIVLLKSNIIVRNLCIYSHSSI
ncbi:MAG: hypothetical protein BAJALOKI2v1_10049 [Promethearchaeota archaeon]|nr:MAG: hypothetical protein BAJALOKI2v1_10049 [Candidatus Lokiarchaeota archaeon]